MLKLSTLFALMIIMLVSCQKESDDSSSVKPKSEYYVTLTADNKDYIFYGFSNAGSVGPALLNTVDLPGTSGDFTRFIVYDTPNELYLQSSVAITGKPVTIPLHLGSLKTSRFDTYIIDNMEPGTLTVTNIDNFTAEGTFKMNMYLSTGSATTKKLTITNGRFRLKL